MAFTSADLAQIDRAIADASLEVRFSDGRMVKYRSMDELLNARAFIAGQIAPAGAPLDLPGGVTFAEFTRD